MTYEERQKAVCAEGCCRVHHCGYAERDMIGKCSYLQDVIRKITVAYVIPFAIAYVSEECQNSLFRNT